MTDLLSYIVVPIVFFFAGIFLRWNKLFINCAVGYRTKLSMSSEEMWHFAQKLASKCLIFVSIIQVIIISLLWALNILDRINDDILYGSEIGMVLGSMVWIEYKLRQENKKSMTSKTLYQEKEEA